jgi:hypothetical protein
VVTVLEPLESVADEGFEAVEGDAGEVREAVLHVGRYATAFSSGA